MRCAELCVVDDIAMCPAQDRDEARHRCEHGERVAMTHREPGVWVDGEQVFQRVLVYG
jgi:hypothetical protein